MLVLMLISLLRALELLSPSRASMVEEPDNPLPFAALWSKKDASLLTSGQPDFCVPSAASH